MSKLFIPPFLESVIKNIPDNTNENPFAALHFILKCELPFKCFHDVYQLHMTRSATQLIFYYFNSTIPTIYKYSFNEFKEILIQWYNPKPLKNNQVKQYKLF